MYHTIGITGLDQKIHKFLWRECKASIPPDILVTTSASFGDRPAGNIATVLYIKLQKWVEKYHWWLLKFWKEGHVLMTILIVLIRQKKQKM